MSLLLFEDVHPASVRLNPHVTAHTLISVFFIHLYQFPSYLSSHAKSATSHGCSPSFFIVSLIPLRPISLLSEVPSL